MPGVIPPIFASSLLFLPMTIVGFSGMDAGDGFLADLSRYMTTGHPVHMIAYASLIAFFAFFYTAVVFNPDENAEMLRNMADLYQAFVRVKIQPSSWTLS